MSLDVVVSGRFNVWERIADSGHKATYQFCPDCGSTLAYVIEGWPGVVAIPVGAFADTNFPSPRFSVYEHRKYPWVESSEMMSSTHPTRASPSTRAGSGKADLGG